jgi:hypothetical protein
MCGIGEGKKWIIIIWILGMSKSGFIHTLPNGRLSVSAIKDITIGLFSSLFSIYLMIFSFFLYLVLLFFCLFFTYQVISLML